MEKFEKGAIVATCGVAADMELSPAFRMFVMKCIDRHSSGDWGDMSSDDYRMNEDALKNGDRIFSGYNIDESLNIDDEKIWIITESDRSATTILYPSEY